MESQFFPKMGAQLAAARKKRFPNDDLETFARRLRVARSTYQRMEKGDLSVSMARYYKAAVLLELEAPFEQLFNLPEQEEGWLSDV